MPANNNGLQLILLQNKKSIDLDRFAVFDGISGDACGEKAVCIVTRTFAGTSVEQDVEMSDNWLTNICLKMNDVVCREAIN